MPGPATEPDQSNTPTTKAMRWWLNLRLGQKIKEDYFLTIYRLAERQILFRGFAIKNAFWFLSVLYLSFVFLSAFLVSRSVHEITSLDLTSFTIAAAAMIGGMLAIVFSIRIVQMQNAAERSSSGFYKILTTNIWQNIVYSVISIFVLILFIIAFSSQYLEGAWFEKIFRIQLPVDIIGITLWLLFLSYWQAFTGIDPQSMEFTPYKSIIKKLNQIQNFANKLARVMENDPRHKIKPSRELSLAAAFQILRPWVNEVQQELDYFFDYHDKLFANKDWTGARTILTRIQNIVLHYFNIRKDSSVLVPTEMLLTNTSDSQGLLTRIFEALKNKGEAYIEIKNDLGATQVIQIFGNLIIASSLINFQGSRKDENPIFTQGKFYLDLVLDKAIASKSLEGCYQASQVYIRIGKLAVYKKLSDQIQGVLQSLRKIVLAGLVEKQNVVWDSGVTGYLVVLEAMIKTKFYNFAVHLRMWRESFQEVLFLVFGLSATGIIADNLFNYTNLARPFDTFPQLAFYITDQYEKETNEGERRVWGGILFELLGEYRSMLGYLSEKMKTADHVIINNISQSIATISILMLEKSKQEAWAQYKVELLKQAHWYLHQLTWFPHYAKSIETNNAFDALVDSISRIGVEAVLTDNEEIAKDAAKLLSSLSIEIYDKPGTRMSDLEGPRMMQNVCYIGILALKSGKRGLVTEVGLKIYEFEEAYTSKVVSKVKLPDGVDPRTVYGAPKPDQLYIEILRWRDDFTNKQLNNHGSFRDDVDERMLELIEEIDIDRFTFEIWGSFAADSPVVQEVEERYKRRAAVRKLIGILKFKLNQLNAK